MTPPPAPPPLLPFQEDLATIVIEIVHCAEDGTPQRHETRALRHYLWKSIGARSPAQISAY